MSTTPKNPHGRRVAVSRLPGRLIVNASADTAPFAAQPSATITEPTSQTIPLGNYPNVRLIFGVTNADGETVNYRVIGWRSCPLGTTTPKKLWVPTLLAQGAVTAGTTTIPGVTLGFYADTITETLGTTGSVISPSTPDNSVATLTLDTKNSQIVTVETDLGTALAAYVWAAPAEDNGVSDIDVAGTGLATSALQTTGNAILTTIDADTSKIPSLGTAIMTGSAPVTVATDDTQFGAVGAAADPDGNVHGQLRSIAERVGSGLPTLGTDATGADAYATIVTAPARETHYIHVSVEDNGLTLSLDGGSTDHYAIPANTERLFPGLVIPSGAVIQGKNITAGSNFTNGRVSVW